ncbi:MAG: transcriptional repressor [Cyanobacteria bacterium REEB67]|nr:transcriptional repressor [Cyanobacteria bacterium REEB67]
MTNTVNDSPDEKLAASAARTELEKSSANAAHPAHPSVDGEGDNGAEGQSSSVDPAFDSLRKRGHRITAQRETILQIFKEQPHGEHLSAEELHAKLLEKGSNVSLATAYRTLKLLSSIGLLRELDFAEGHKHYELKQDTLPHQHIICTGCNLTLEFEDHFLEEAGQKIGKRYNFEVIDAQFKIFGQCPSCKAAKGARK